MKIFLFCSLFLITSPLRAQCYSEINGILLKDYEISILNAYTYIYEVQEFDSSKIFLLEYQIERDTLILDCSIHSGIGFVSYALSSLQETRLEYCSWMGYNVVKVIPCNDSVGIEFPDFIESVQKVDLKKYLDTNEILSNYHRAYLHERERGHHNREFDTILELNSYFQTLRVVSLHVELIRYHLFEDQVVKKSVLFRD